MRYKVVTVDIDGGQNQTSHEDYQTKCQAAQSVEGRLLGPEWQDQLFLVLTKHTHTHK